MLQIIKRKDADGYEDILLGLGLNAYDTDISESISDGEVTGYAIYKILPDAVYFYAVNANGDLVLYDGIVRSVLFLAALRGIERAHFMLDDNSLTASLGFITVNSSVLEPISSVLGSCSGCN